LLCHFGAFDFDCYDNFEMMMKNLFSDREIYSDQKCPGCLFSILSIFRVKKILQNDDEIKEYLTYTFLGVRYTS
jgi:hypothetical protein